jgi:outer membrane lipoprotein-sorting protein
MKNLILTIACMFLVSFLNAQTLEEIVKKYSAANKLDKLMALSTLKISLKTSAAGNDMQSEMWMKKPNKIKSVTSVGGQQIVLAFDGEKGYMINPLMGSPDPVELDPTMTRQQLTNRNLLQNNLETYLKEGKLALEPEEKVDNKPAFKIKENLDGGNVVYLYIDKVNYLPLKLSATITQMGQTVAVDSYPSDFKETNGIFLPMKTTASMAGIEVVTTFEKVEVNIPIEDSIFKIK